MRNFLERFGGHPVVMAGVFLAIVYNSSLVGQQSGASQVTIPKRLFPHNNFWNAPVDALPLHPNSAGIIREVNKSGEEHIRINDTLPINFVHGRGMPLTSFKMGGDADGGQYLVPPDAVIESAGRIADADHHLLVVDVDSGILYELFSWNKLPTAAGADIGCKWDLASNAQRVPGPSADAADFGSTDAAGLPVTPGVLRYQEILDGVVTHALRVTVRLTAFRQFIWPATHFTSQPAAKGNPNAPPFGTRIRLKVGFDVSGYSPTNRIILNALKKYGAVVADNGIAGSMEHDQDPRWNKNELLLLHNVSLGNFEVVDTSEMQVSPASAQVQPVVPSLMAMDKLGRPNAITLGRGLSFEDAQLVSSGAPPNRPEPGQPNRIYAYYPSSDAKQWVWKPIVVDPNVGFYVDAGGQAHLGKKP